MSRYTVIGRILGDEHLRMQASYIL